MYTAAMRASPIFRRLPRSLSALALLAWLGMVSMGMAHAMPHAGMTAGGAMATAMSTHANSASHAQMPHAQTPSPSCGMSFGCHCGGLCFGLTLPRWHVLSPAPTHAGLPLDRVPPIPASYSEPPLHPPSA
jgi:hypothetical protein